MKLITKEVEDLLKDYPRCLQGHDKDPVSIFNAFLLRENELSFPWFLLTHITIFIKDRNKSSACTADIYNYSELKNDKSLLGILLGVKVMV
jgi:hypothetical protein